MLPFLTSLIRCLCQLDVNGLAITEAKSASFPRLTASAVGSRIAVVRLEGPVGWLPVGFRQLAAPESSSARRLFALERLCSSKKEQLRDQAPQDAPCLKPGSLAPGNVLHENTLHENVLLKNILPGNALLETFCLRTLCLKTL
ncbi:hypothetical protein GGP81_003298 [Salinibacter ruber]|nr:hypothetical protein [Salinibacter ruber]